MKLRYILIVLCLCFGKAVSAKQDTNIQETRIISAGGSVTEILYELGLGDNIIAVDTTSNYPQAAQTLPKVGYFRALSTEGLLSLNPTMLIGAKGVGPKNTLEQIENFGVEVKVLAQDDYSLESWKNQIRQLGAYFTRKEKAQALIARVERNLNVLKNTVGNKKYKAIALLSMGKTGPVAAGKNTVPNVLFELANIENIAKDLNGYKLFNPEQLAQQDIDLIILPSHFAANIGNKEDVCKHPAIEFAVKGDKCPVHIMDGLLLLGFGSRIDEAVTEIVTQVKP